ncbi:MAG: serine/threonine-protein phosphatase [Planctomycetota bacterium]|nr:MAG: serine/threonine-protein phosphatase [Planctomycetota bacterium]
MTSTPKPTSMMWSRRCTTNDCRWRSSPLRPMLHAKKRGANYARKPVTHLRRLMASGMAIGVARSADLAQRLTMRETTLPVGSSLVVYTDGVNEARNTAEEEFSEERVMGSLLVSSRGSMQQQVDALFDEAVSFANGEQDDDITVLGIRRLEE